MNRGVDAVTTLSRRHAGQDMGSQGDGAVLTTYEVLVRADLGDDLVSELGARSFTPCHGKTLVVVDVIDQSHLHGVIAWFQDHNIDVERVNPV